MADIGALLLVTLLLVGVAERLWSLTTVLEYVPYFIILGIIALLSWGYRERLQGLRLKLSQNEEVSSAERAERDHMEQGQVLEPAQPEVVPANLSSPNTTKNQDAILANIVETMSNLNLRYSRGEITREEYLKAKSDLQIVGKHEIEELRPNLMFDDAIIIERQPRFLRFPGDNEEQTLSNMIDCYVTICNIPLNKSEKPDGKASARKVPIKLHLQRESDNKSYDLQLIWLRENNPYFLDEIPNDGQPIPVYFLRFEPEKAQIWVPIGPVLAPGDYGHEVILPGVYDLRLMVGSAIWEMKSVKLPDFLNKEAKPSEKATYCRDNGGYVVYVDQERYSEEGYDIVINCDGAIPQQRLEELFKKYKPFRMLVNGEPWEPEPERIRA